MSKVESFAISRNYLRGQVPCAGMVGMTVLKELYIHKNELEGMLPEPALHRMRALSSFYLYSNEFRGVLPSEGLRGKGFLESFIPAWNHLQGMLPVNGLKGLTTLRVFYPYKNNFEGMFPVEGLRAMTALRQLVFPYNRFQGTLSSLALKAMRHISVLVANTNKLSGTVPSVLCACTSLHFLTLGDNNFQGHLPELSDLSGLYAEHNLLAGAIPQGAIRRKIVLAGMQHEGTVPVSLRRMSRVNTSVVLGHHLEGHWPAVPAATFDCLSVWANNLEGHLPEVHLSNKSDVLVHRNQFSCQLPRNGFVQPKLSMALIGNSFMLPNAFPPWIHVAERGELFCVAQGRKLLLTLMLPPVLFCLVVGLSWTWRSSRHASQVWYGPGEAARRAWHRTLKLQTMFSLASCVLLFLYNSVGTLACTVVFQRLHFPVVAKSRPVQTSFALLVWLCTAFISKRFFHSHVSVTAATRTQQRGRRSEAKSRSEAAQSSAPGTRVLGQAVVWNIWFVLCVLVAAPGALYAAVKAIPGFLSLQGTRQWFVDGSLFFFTAIGESIGLVKLAHLLCTAARTQADEVELLTIGQLLSIPVLPGLVTVACHAECLGAWVYFWAPCRAATCDADAFREHVAQLSRSVDASGIALRRKILSREDVCGLNRHMRKDQCADAVVERLVRLLFARFVHQTFSIPGSRVLTDVPMRLKSSCVLLGYVWLVTLMFGACIPLLFPLSMLLALVHSAILFDHYELVAREDVDGRAHLTQVGLGFAVCTAVLLELCITLPT
eukprot:673632-Amphidinium_carterae.1